MGKSSEAVYQRLLPAGRSMLVAGHRLLAPG
jgi:hypothetical protein